VCVCVCVCVCMVAYVSNQEHHTTDDNTTVSVLEVEPR